MSRLLLVRHGESEWNALGRWQGQADPPLSDHGKHQASSAAGRIGTVDLVASSTLQRAAHTAQIISEVLGIGPVHLDPRLIERDAGEWSGLTRQEIKIAWPGYLAEDPDDRSAERRPPGWEVDESLLVRATEALTGIAEIIGAGGTGVVVTHGGVVYAIEAMLGAPRRYLPNLGARWIDVAPMSSEHTMTLGERIQLYDPDADPYQPDATPVDSEAV